MGGQAGVVENEGGGMQLVEKFAGASVPEGFHWFNEPVRHKVGAGLEIWTDAETDFWQRTHKGNRRCSTS